MDAEIYAYDNEIKFMKHLEFGILGNTEINEGSALGQDTPGIDIPELYENLNPKKGGLIDTRLGTTDNHLECATCGLNPIWCVGHFGHIKLAEPMYNIGYIDFLKKILSCVCIKCSKLLVNKNENELFEMLKNKSGKMRLLEIKNLVKNVQFCNKENYGCGTPVPKIKKEGGGKNSASINIVAETILTNQPIDVNNLNDTNDGKKKIEQILTPEDCYNICKNISDTDCTILGFNSKICRPEMMIYIYFPVPPVSVRPSARGDSSSGFYEDDLTHKLADIVKFNNKLSKYKESNNENMAKYEPDYIKLLQLHIATFYDNDTLSLPKSEQKGKMTKSVSSRIKGKDGRIRMNLMGKRTNFSARTVITGDPTLNINELGMPLTIAMNLTFPEIVSPYNYNFLQELVNNGRYKYPGANFVYLMNSGENKRLLPIDLRYRRERLILNYGDIVERHLIDNDIVLLNRQPTLHKQSMMGHRLKVNKDPSLSSFRINISVTTPYNADFDGDEMNIFVPQSIQTKIELEEIANVKYQIMAPTSNTTIGIIQDGLLGAYNLTQPDIEIGWRNAMNMLTTTSFDDFDSIKKYKKYNGQELFSKIIPPNINIYKNDKNNLIINNGVIKEGFLSKNILGAKKKNNLTQLIWDEYGADKSQLFLNNAQRLLDYFNLYRGFTVGIGDAYISKQIEESILTIFETKNIEINHIITEVENNYEMNNQDDFEKSITGEIDSIRTEINNIAMEYLKKDNNFLKMVNSGAKGEALNIGQISCTLGQQQSEGKRLSKKINNRSLVYFNQNEDTMLARGYIVSSFLKGLSWTEFVFHNITAREGLIDTAIKTADSGYVARKLIKSLEDAMVKYDGTVRSATNTIIQFNYGDSGIDTMKQHEHFINLIQLNETDIENMYKFTKSELSDLNKNIKNMNNYDNDLFHNFIVQLRNNIRNIYIKTNLNINICENKFMIPVNLSSVINKFKSNKNKITYDLDPLYIINQINYILQPNVTLLTYMTVEELNDPNNQKYKDDQLSKTLFKTALFDILSPKRCIFEYKFSKDQFDQITHVIIQNFKKTTVEPGEMVGTIAAQSFGEPITQMSMIYNTRVLIYNKNTHEMYNSSIGLFIDNIINSNTTTDNYNNTTDNCNNTIINLNNTFDLNIIGVSNNEKTNWKKISQVSRHPANGGIMTVFTKSGKSTTTTLSHSHLQKSLNGIIPIRGDQLKIGDKIPVVKYMPQIDNINNISSPFLLNLNDIKCLIYNYYNNASFDEKNNIITLHIHNAKTTNDIILLLTYFGIFSDISYNSKSDIVIQSQYVEIFKNKILNLNNSIIEDKYEIDIVWDEIVKIEYLDDPNEYVYDFTVPGNDNFMVDNGILVHNTLNTFHFSGVVGQGSSNLGLSRMKELFHYSKNIKTPQMKIFLNDNIKNNKNIAYKIVSNIEFTTINHLRKQLDVYYDTNPYKKNGIMQQDNVTNLFHSINNTKNKCSEDINNLPWLIRIELDTEMMMLKEVTLLDIKSKFCNNWEKRFMDTKTLIKDERTILEKITQCSILSNNNNDKQPVIHIRFDMTKYDYNTVLSIIDIFIDKFKIKGINSVNKVYPLVTDKVLVFDKNAAKKDNYVIFADGVNLLDIRYINGIDLNKTLTNDIVTIYSYFGIEAARTVLLTEIIKGLSSNGSHINHQHLSILVDIMTNTGIVTSIDRHGMNKVDNDPLSRASFERPIEQLVTAAVFSEIDQMNSVSSRIMAGLVIKGGTGLCNIILDTDLIQNSEKTEHFENIETKYFDNKFIEFDSDINSVVNDISNSNHKNIFFPE
jgi:DNA-directed RNA polymerase II subunit RPB1